MGNIAERVKDQKRKRVGSNEDAVNDVAASEKRKPHATILRKKGDNAGKGRNSSMHQVVIFKHKFSASYIFEDSNGLTYTNVSSDSDCSDEAEPDGDNSSALWYYLW
ncbi:hypothetical protein RYX36_018848 [Vicia faba]